MKNVVSIIAMVLLLGVFGWGAAWADGMLNINNATAEQLTALPGIGPAIAGKIVEYRAEHPFKTVEEIKEIKGIGPAKFEAIKNSITVGNAAEKKE